ncbi:hypothetical protein OS493_009125 [Desmophyllum pertusum]|uniref:Uncharacterized protein n=1 Tax=Desmophyllum pertusum TaxID=174260 RepID=A0A9W9Z1U7_9CNID|nr:hypothetical protein OS493_009125 [Desmophyllum pertusum]
MQTGWKFALVLLVATILCLRCTNSTKTKTKLLKRIWHSEQHKAAHPKTLTGQKKNDVQPVQAAVPQPSNEQVAAMQNPESLQPSETEELNNLQNYNKQYINNEMAAETALLADQGIDDDSALKISNMAALPDGMPPGSNAAIKAKISSAHAQQGKSAGPSQASQSSQASPAGYDPNAYLYDANSWPEYTIHDSDYSNFRSVEMNNMNGENTDMPIYKPNRRPGMAGYPNMGNEEGMEYQGQKFPKKKKMVLSLTTNLNKKMEKPHRRSHLMTKENKKTEKPRRKSHLTTKQNKKKVKLYSKSRKAKEVRYQLKIKVSYQPQVTPSLLLTADPME